MNKRVIDILAYVSPMGLLIALVLDRKKQSRFHENQALVSMITYFLLANLNLGGSLQRIINSVVLMLWVMGFVYACMGTEREVPLTGKIKLLK